MVVDGASVTTTTTTSTTSTGQTVNQTTQTVAPVGTPPAGGDGLVDVPLVSDASGNPLLAVSLPSGVGVQVTSISGTGLSLDSQVSTAVQGFTSGGDPGLATAVTEGLQDAFGSAPPANLVVRSMAVTVEGNTPPTQPIQISGSTNGNEALIIDVSSLPSGTVLDLSNVRFAVIVGNTNIVGGEGRNVVVADGGQQFMVLGADDDELHAGAGDDTVGSKGGNDKLWGDEGNDKVVGGIGNDELHGGDGNDLLQGGASDAGRWSVQLDSQGQMRLFFTPGNAQLADSTGLSLVGNWTSAQGQGAITDARLSFIHQDYGLLQDVALLIHGLSGRLPSLSELSLFGALGLGSGALAEIAHGYHVQTSGVQPQAIEAQLQAVISRVLGAAGSDAARQSLFNQSKAVLDNGGNWADVWLTVVRSDFHKASMLGSESGTINLVRNSALAETGWSLNSGDNQLFGDAGNDVLVGGAGNNVLDGGSGTDLAVLFGSWSDFQVARQGADLLLKNVVSGSVNTLRDVEFIQVGTQALSTSAMANLPANGAYTELKPLADQLIATVGLANTAAVTWHPEWV